MPTDDLQALREKAKEVARAEREKAKAIAKSEREKAGQVLIDRQRWREKDVNVSPSIGEPTGAREIMSRPYGELIDRTVSNPGLNAFLQTLAYLPDKAVSSTALPIAEGASDIKRAIVNPEDQFTSQAEMGAGLTKIGMGMFGLTSLPMLATGVGISSASDAAAATGKVGEKASEFIQAPIQTAFNPSTRKGRALATMGDAALQTLIGKAMHNKYGDPEKIASDRIVKGERKAMAADENVSRAAGAVLQSGEPVNTVKDAGIINNIKSIDTEYLKKDTNVRKFKALSDSFDDSIKRNTNLANQLLKTHKQLYPLEAFEETVGTPEAPTKSNYVKKALESLEAITNTGEAGDGGVVPADRIKPTDASRIRTIRENANKNTLSLVDLNDLSRIFNKYSKTWDVSGKKLEGLQGEANASVWNGVKRAIKTRFNNPLFEKLDADTHDKIRIKTNFDDLSSKAEALRQKMDATPSSRAFSMLAKSLVGRLTSPRYLMKMAANLSGATGDVKASGGMALEFERNIAKNIEKLKKLSKAPADNSLITEIESYIANPPQGNPPAGALPVEGVKPTPPTALPPAPEQKLLPENAASVASSPLPNVPPIAPEDRQLPSAGEATRKFTVSPTGEVSESVPLEISSGDVVKYGSDVPNKSSGDALIAERSSIIDRIMKGQGTDTDRRRIVELNRLIRPGASKVPAEAPVVADKPVQEPAAVAEPAQPPIEPEKVAPEPIKPVPAEPAAEQSAVKTPVEPKKELSQAEKTAQVIKEKANARKKSGKKEPNKLDTLTAERDRILDRVIKGVATAEDRRRLPELNIDIRSAENPYAATEGMTMKELKAENERLKQTLRGAGDIPEYGGDLGTGFDEYQKKISSPDAPAAAPSAEQTASQETSKKKRFARAQKRETIESVDDLQKQVKDAIKEAETAEAERRKAQKQSESEDEKAKKLAELTAKIRKKNDAGKE